jgi:hypothetical protein
VVDPPTEEFVVLGEPTIILAADPAFLNGASSVHGAVAAAWVGTLDVVGEFYEGCVEGCDGVHVSFMRIQKRCFVSCFSHPPVFAVSSHHRKDGAVHRQALEEL